MVCYMQLRIHRDGYVLGSEFVNDLVEGDHKKEQHKDGHKDEHKGGGKQKVEIHKRTEDHGRILFSFVSQNLRSQS